MWQRLGRRNANKHSGATAPLSGALGRVGGLFGGQETKKHVRTTTYGGPVGLGLLGALALVATVSIVLVLSRRAARRGNFVEESNGEPIEANEESGGAGEGYEGLGSSWQLGGPRSVVA